MLPNELCTFIHCENTPESFATRREIRPRAIYMVSAKNELEFRTPGQSLLFDMCDSKNIASY